MAIKEQLILEGVNKTDGAFRGVNRNVKQLNTGFSTLQKSLIGIGATLATGAFAKSIITTSMRFEDLRTSLKSVTGSAQEGAEAFAFITKFSTQTQFSVEDLSTAFIKLKASGIEPRQELLTTFEEELGGVNLRPSAKSGCFDISVDGNLVWSRENKSRFPEMKVLKQKIRDHVAPERDLGHSDIKSQDCEA